MPHFITGQALTAYLGEAISTTQPYAYVAYCDSFSTDGHNLSIAHLSTVLNGTTPVDIAGEPSGNFDQRIVKVIAIHNLDVIAHIIKVQYNTDVGFVNRAASIGANEILHYEDGRGWYVTDANCAEKVNANFTHKLLDGNFNSDTNAATVVKGDLVVGNSTPLWDRFPVGSDTQVLTADSTQTKGVKWAAPASASGSFVKTTVLTSGTTFTTGSTTNKIRIRLRGGGGGGGGAATGAASAAAGGGGGAGGYAEKVFNVSPSTGYTYAIGAAGNGGGAGNNAGSTGGDTTFTVSATTVTAKGGIGGQGSPAGNVQSTAIGGAPSPVSTNGDLNGTGGPGDIGITFTGLIAVSGFGASTDFGGGGQARNNQGDGAAASGYGAGGGGGCCLNNGGNQAGGNGSQGIIVVDEFT